MRYTRNLPRNPFTAAALTAAVALLPAGFISCSRGPSVRADASARPTQVTVGVASVTRKPIERDLTLSSELVPFQQIEVYAKQSGYVKQLFVDYGDRVKKDQILAILEIPELAMLLQQDDASIKNASDQVRHAENELTRVGAQHRVSHLEYERLNGVAKSRPDLVAQQEIDDAEGRDLAAEAQVEGAKSALQAAQSELLMAKAKRQHDKVLYDYSRITAPFAGVITQRYANLGTLMQAGTNSSTQAMPLVRLSEDDRFRLVIPVPESYVKYVKIGDPVEVHVPSLDRTIPGRITRFSVDVKEDTRTMHTEVDVANPNHVLIPGVYAEATLRLDRKADALTVPLQAVSQNGDQSTVDVVNSAGRIETRDVRIGARTSLDAEILSGLRPGEEVVVSDRSSLQAGELVRPHAVQAADYQTQQ